LLINTDMGYRDRLGSAVAFIRTTLSKSPNSISYGTALTPHLPILLHPQDLYYGIFRANNREQAAHKEKGMFSGILKVAGKIWDSEPAPKKSVSSYEEFIQYLETHIKSLQTIINDFQPQINRFTGLATRGHCVGDHCT
jgi:hypothetical protein